MPTPLRLGTPITNGNAARYLPHSAFRVSICTIVPVKTSKVRTAAMRGPVVDVLQLFRCQYLYFCTSKASIFVPAGKSSAQAPDLC